MNKYMNKVKDKDKDKGKDKDKDKDEDKNMAGIKTKLGLSNKNMGSPHMKSLGSPIQILRYCV